MQTLWFALAAVMMAIYVVMDGFDFGAGALHLFVARRDDERRQVMRAIGPFWDGNEVWLLAVGGVLVMAFPKVLGAALSGFYLAIMMVLWVLILRGISLEFRSHLPDALWRQFWDATFAVASTLAPVLLGAALGNLVRGVPLDVDGWFALPLFASFSPSGALGILDWYTVLAGVLAWVALAHHGALFLAWKTDGAVRERSLEGARWLYPAMLMLWMVTTVATAWLVPELFDALVRRPVAWFAALVAVGGLVGTGALRQRGRDLAAFIASGSFLLGILAATAASAYPVMLRAVGDAGRSLTAFNSASSDHALATGLWWWPVGFVLAIGYVALLFRVHRGKVERAGARSITGLIAPLAFLLLPTTADAQSGAPVLRWFKGNTHTHTINSDGDSSPDDVVKWYKEHGYQFLVLTDHNVLTSVEGLNALYGLDDKFLVIRGEEITDTFKQKPIHINGLDAQRLIEPQGGASVLEVIQRDVDAIRAAGAVPHINHPNFGWAITAEDLRQVRNNRLFEIFNGHPMVNNLGGGGVPGLEEAWDAILTSGVTLYGIAVDDAHHFKRPDDRTASRPGQGWVVVRAERLDARSLLAALERGDFYASTGVELSDYQVTKAAMTVTVRRTGYSKYRIQFIGHGGKLLQESLASPATYTFRGDEGYVRSRIVESNGLMAWTQPVRVGVSP